MQHKLNFTNFDIIFVRLYKFKKKILLETDNTHNKRATMEKKKQLVSRHQKRETEGQQAKA